MAAPDPTSHGTAPTLVVGYDGSAGSRAALRFAAHEATPDGRVVVVHAYELPLRTSWPEYARLLNRVHEAGARLLDGLPLGEDEFVGPRYELELVGAPPARALDVVARSQHADRIVVGAHAARAGAESGGVPGELRALANRPVVVITPDC
jgi:nucleotide-binding universal stress UspA family protein